MQGSRPRAHRRVGGGRARARRSGGRNSHGGMTTLLVVRDVAELIAAARQLAGLPVVISVGWPRGYSRSPDHCREPGPWRSRDSELRKPDTYDLDSEAGPEEEEGHRLLDGAAWPVPQVRSRVEAQGEGLPGEPDLRLLREAARDGSVLREAEGGAACGAAGRSGAGACAGHLGACAGTAGPQALDWAPEPLFRGAAEAAHPAPASPPPGASATAAAEGGSEEAGSVACSEGAAPTATATAAASTAAEGARAEGPEGRGRAAHERRGQAEATAEAALGRAHGAPPERHDARQDPGRAREAPPTRGRTPGAPGRAHEAPPAPRHEAPEREAEEGPALGWPSRTPELWEASFDQQRLQQRLAGELEQLRLEHFEQLEGSGERAHAARASDSEAGGEEADGQRSPLQGKHTPEGRSATAPLPLSEASTAASETELHGGGCGSAKPLELPETLRLPLAGIPWADASLEEQDGAPVKATAREAASQREPAAAEKDDAEKAAARAEWLRLVALEPLYRQAEGDQLGQPGEAWCSLARAQPRSGGRGHGSK